MLIFSQDTCIVLIARMISTNAISSQILTFVTSHFATINLKQMFVFVTASLSCRLKKPTACIGSTELKKHWRYFSQSLNQDLRRKSWWCSWYVYFKQDTLIIMKNFDINFLRVHCIRPVNKRRVIACTRLLTCLTKARCAICRTPKIKLYIY